MATQHENTARGVSYVIFAASLIVVAGLAAIGGLIFGESRWKANTLAAEQARDKSAAALETHVSILENAAEKLNEKDRQISQLQTPFARVGESISVSGNTLDLPKWERDLFNASVRIPGSNGVVLYQWAQLTWRELRDLERDASRREMKSMPGEPPCAAQVAIVGDRLYFDAYMIPAKSLSDDAYDLAKSHFNSRLEKYTGQPLP